MLIGYKFQFLSPLHIGRRGIGVEEVEEKRVPSDTIYGAIIYALANIYGGDEVSHIIDRFMNRDPPFILSSTLPLICSDGQEMILVHAPLSFPHDILKLPNLSEDFPRLMVLRGRLLKILKDISFTDLDFIKEVLLGKEISVEEVNIKKRIVRLRIDDKYYTADKDKGVLVREKLIDIIPKILWKTEKRVRNVVDRNTKATDIYYLGLLHLMTPHVLLVDIDRNYIGKFEAALKYLSEAGLGGERAYGFGRFSFTKLKKDIIMKIEELFKISNNNAIISQSIYSPTDHEWRIIQDFKSLFFYTGFFKGGYGGRSIIRSSTLCLIEGSTFPSNLLQNKKSSPNLQLRPIGRCVIDKIKGEQVIRIFFAFYIPWRVIHAK